MKDDYDRLAPYLGKIIKADCMEILRSLPDKSIDLVLTDPPYGCVQRGIGIKDVYGGKSKEWDTPPPVPCV